MASKPPSDDVMAVIVAAVDAVWPRAVVADPRARTNDDESPSWRFSGRSWGSRAAANRSRPTF
ncbi:MAG: hypothetical protein H0U92_05490 [Actinobacteria bacterium]|nr:hypothetical protein [Actinomycetota bacterium]